MQIANVGDPGCSLKRQYHFTYFSALESKSLTRVLREMRLFQEIQEN